MDQPGPRPCVLLADKRYDADFILAGLKARVVAVIPAKRNRKIQPVIDGRIYALRSLVERCFSKLKHSRRLATRYDKTGDSFLGFVLVASIRLWVRQFVHTTWRHPARRFSNALPSRRALLYSQGVESCYRASIGQGEIYFEFSQVGQQIRSPRSMLTPAPR
ncbi:MAG: transposase [Candidatus Devosia euplotis]|nr:transposase [Candidatus Devosia euplotis]